LFYILEAAYLFVHLAYFLYFKEIFHIRQSLQQFFEGITIVKNFVIPKDLRYFIVLLDLPFFLFIAIRFLKFSRFINAHYKIINLRRIFFFISAIFLVPLSYKPIIIPAYTGCQNKEEIEIIKRQSLFMNDFFSCLFYQDEKTLIKNFDYGKPFVFRNGTQAQLKNIICIQVESLDANIINAKYKGEYVTPFLHKLSFQSIYYPCMLTYRFGAGNTSDIEFAVINSVIPLRDFPSLKLKNYDYPNSFVKRLEKSGYETEVFHNNIGSFFNRDVAFLKFGFQEFCDLKKMKLKQYGWGAKDEDVFNYVKNKLKVQKAPFLYYIITMSSHEPFRLVKSYYTNKIYSDISDDLIKNYFSSMSYVDKTLEDFVAFVKNNINNTYIFVWGDHAANVKGSYLIQSSKINFVPLFIITTDNEQYIENSQSVSILDLAPTILYASGINFEIMTKGVNLLDFPIKEGVIPFGNGQIVDRRYLFRKFRSVQFSEK
jgi:phosphoglycerol transferase MdoB-like AlkP superfamily enzyme